VDPRGVSEGPGEDFVLGAGGDSVDGACYGNGLDAGGVGVRGSEEGKVSVSLLEEIFGSFISWLDLRTLPRLASRSARHSRCCPDCRAGVQPRERSVARLDRFFARYTAL